MLTRDTTLKQLIKLKFDMPTIQMKHSLSMVHEVRESDD